MILGRTTIALTPSEDRSLRELIAGEVPDLAVALEHGYAVDRMEQPWFRGFNVLDVQLLGAAPRRRFYVAVELGGGRRMSLLSGRLAALHHMAAIDPPLCLDLELLAAPYAIYASAWTCEQPLGEVSLARFEDLPWRPELSADERTRVEVLRLRFAARLSAERRWHTPQGWHVHGWWLSAQTLLERELVVPPSGKLVRVDTAQAIELPVATGAAWDVVDGRPRPVL